MNNSNFLKRFFATSALGFIILTLLIVALSKNSNVINSQLIDYSTQTKNNTINIDSEFTTEKILASYSTRSIAKSRANNIISRSSVSREESNYISVDQIKISKDMDLTQRCNISKEDFIELMKNLKPDTSGFFEENASLIYDLCEKYSLNEIFFCGLISAESGWNIASNHRNAHNYISLMSSNGLIHFDSVESGLEKAASILHEKYLSEDGAFYTGKTLEAVRKRFCPVNPGWTSLVYGCMQQILE